MNSHGSHSWNHEPFIVVSGGQTGVDRAALDAALALGIKIGGWCPRGRKAEDGEIPSRYPLTETKTEKYTTRTKWNVRDSDATLIICHNEPGGGTARTIKYCKQLGKPYYIHSIQPPLKGVSEALLWIKSNHPRVLNVAGPRENTNNPVYDPAYEFLLSFFSKL